MGGRGWGGGRVCVGGGGWGATFFKKFSPFELRDELPAFARWTNYHLLTEMKQSLVACPFC